MLYSGLDLHFWFSLVGRYSANNVLSDLKRVSFQLSWEKDLFHLLRYIVELKNDGAFDRPRGYSIFHLFATRYIRPKKWCLTKQTNLFFVSKLGKIALTHLSLKISYCIFVDKTYYVMTISKIFFKKLSVGMRWMTVSKWSKIFKKTFVISHLEQSSWRQQNFNA